jgi:hypothetical protein
VSRCIRGQLRDKPCNFDASSYAHTARLGRAGRRDRRRSTRCRTAGWPMRQARPTRDDCKPQLNRNPHAMNTYISSSPTPRMKTSGPTKQGRNSEHWGASPTCEAACQLAAASPPGACIIHKTSKSQSLGHLPAMAAFFCILCCKRQKNSLGNRHQSCALLPKMLGTLPQRPR